MKKRAVGTLLVSIGIGISPLTTPSPAWASAPNPIAQILPAEPVAGFVPSDIRVRLEQAGVWFVEVESTIVWADIDDDITSTEFSSRDVLDPARVSAAIRANPPSGYVVAGIGDVVAIPWLHRLALAPGIYAERILATLLIAGRDDPIVEVGGYRYFEVSDMGEVLPITGEDYSHSVYRFMTLADGTIEIAGASAPGAAPAGDASKPHFCIRHSGTPGDAVPPGSEVNER